jgi:hypothetical protein
MRALAFDKNNNVIPVDGPEPVHHYRTVRRVHPNGCTARVVLDTSPGYPGEIIEIPWPTFHKCVVKAAEVM